MDRQRHIYWKSVDLLGNDRLSDVPLSLMAENRTVIKGRGSLLEGMSGCLPVTNSSESAVFDTFQVSSRLFLSLEHIDCMW